MTDLAKTATTRLEVVLRALGFDNPVDEERNPNNCWINLWFNGLEVEILDLGQFVVRGPNSTDSWLGFNPDHLIDGIGVMLKRTMSILSDEECGIR